MTSFFSSQRRAALVSGRRDSTCRGSSLAPSHRLLRVEILESRELLANINNVVISEGNSGTVNAVFTVSRSSADPATLNYHTTNGTAVAPADYASQSGSLGPGQNTITISVLGDSGLERAETFFVNVNGAFGRFDRNQGHCVILNDDQQFIVAAPGLGSEPSVRVLDPSGSLIREFLAYDAKFRGGVSVA